MWDFAKQKLLELLQHALYNLSIISNKAHKI